MKDRCKHLSAWIVSHEGGRVNAYCECGQGWFGFDNPWWSRRGKFHKPPKWVTRLLEAPASLASRKEGEKKP